MAARCNGKVVWFKDHKGFGFIRPDDSDSDVFFHWSYLKQEGYKTIKPDTKVSFDLGENHKGPMAINIEFGADEIKES